MSPTCIAVTGLDTLAGLRTVERLLRWPEPPAVVGIDVAVPRRLDGRIRFHRVDLTEPTADSVVAEVLEKEGCDALLHAAFFERAVDPAQAHELEVIGSLHVMNACAAAGVDKLVFTSTARVYGALPDNPGFLTEDHALRGHPEGPHIADRVEIEKLLDLFARRHPGTSVTVLRPSWVIGPTADSQIIQHLDRRRVTTVMGFDPLLQLLHEDDFLRAIELALRSDARGPFNLAGSGVLPLGTLLRLAGKRARAVPHPLLYRVEYLSSLWSAGAPPSELYDYLRFPWCVDISRARTELGFEPEYSTKEAWMSFVVSRRMRGYR